MPDTEPAISDASIADAIDGIDDPEFTPSVDDVRAVLDELQGYLEENDWDAILENINDGHAEIHHLSAVRLVTITAYEGFSVPLENLGYDTSDSPLFDLVRRVHRIEARKHTDDDPDGLHVEPLVLALPPEDP